MDGVVDAVFSHPRLAALYDDFDGARDDLPHYEDLVAKLGARRVLDVGCGTGSLACRLARAGFEVVGVDPARASLDVGRSKPGGQQVRWSEGVVTSLPPMRVDVALMTGNVAQVFLTDSDLSETLEAVRDRLTTGGHLVLESRRPEHQAWLEWQQDDRASAEVDGVGSVVQRREVTSVDLPLVSFRLTYTFPDGAEVVSDSTLRFRTEDELRRLLGRAGFSVREVRQAPDRPGREYVVIAARTS